MSSTLKLVLAAVIAVFIVGGLQADNDAAVEERRQVEAPYTPGLYGSSDTNN